MSEIKAVLLIPAEGDAEVGERIQRLPALAVIGGAKAAYLFAWFANRDGGGRFGGTADDGSLLRADDGDHAVIAAIAERPDGVLLVVVNDGAIVQRADPFVGRQFENRMPEATGVGQVFQGYVARDGPVFAFVIADAELRDAPATRAFDLITRPVEQNAAVLERGQRTGIDRAVGDTGDGR